MNKKMFFLGIICLLIAVSSMIIYSTNNYDEVKIEPCVDGLEGRIVSENMSCEHTYTINDTHIIIQYLPIFLPFGLVFIMGGLILEEVDEE